ncbi:MAG: hypothetical protein ACRCX2_20075 [Paraclostridium sp.]
MENNQLQQSSNEGIIIGKLKEKKIEFSVGKESGKAYAKGFLTVVVNTIDGINEIKVSVMQMATKKDGGENGLYKALQTINAEYKSIVEHGEELADTIKIKAQLEMNDYFNKNKDEVSSFLQVKGSIMERVDATSEHMAKFKIGGFIETITDKDDKTADVAMTAIAYGGKALPIVVNIPAEGVAPFKGMFYPQCTADINFDLVNAVEVTKSTETVGWGQAFETTAEKRIRLNRAFGGNVLPVGYVVDQIVQVKNIREQHLQTVLAEGREKASSAPAGNAGAPAGGFGVGFGVQTGGQPATGQPAGFGAGFGQPAGFGAGANPFVK